jgi:hypothetical protein
MWRWRFGADCRSLGMSELVSAAGLRWDVTGRLRPTLWGSTGCPAPVSSRTDPRREPAGTGFAALERLGFGRIRDRGQAPSCSCPRQRPAAIGPRRSRSGRASSCGPLEMSCCRRVSARADLVSQQSACPATVEVECSQSSPHLLALRGLEPPHRSTRSQSTALWTTPGSRGQLLTTRGEPCAGRLGFQAFVRVAN